MNLSAVHRTDRLVRIPVVAFLIGFFSYVARHRLIDADEGFYLLASQLVIKHKAPYLDFFFTQAPLLPYAYGLWMKLFGISWLSARSLSTLLAAMVGLLVYEHVWRETGKWIAGLAAVVLFVSSVLVFGWFPVAKTYSLAAVFLFAAYVIVARLSDVSPRWLVVSAGLLFGLSVDTRSYVVGLTPVFLLWIFLHSGARQRYSRVLWFLGGFMIGLVPCLCLFAASPDTFLFNNLGFHVIRSSAGFIADWGQKKSLAKRFLSGREDDGAQFISLAAVSFVILALRKRGGSALLALLIAFVLGCISMLPTPTFVQYLCVCMPFLIVAAVCAVSDYSTSLGTAAHRQLAAFTGTVLMLIFVASAIPGLRAYLARGSVVGVVAGDAPNWTLRNVMAVSEAIDQLAAPDEEVVSFWPGYIVASHAAPYPGLESDFGWLIANKLTAFERKKYHIRVISDLTAGFAAHSPRIVVVGNQKNGGVPQASEFARILASSGYAAVRTMGNTSIFVCCSTGR